MRSSPSWWASKVRQFRAHVRASVGPAERPELETWLTDAQLAMFDGMHVADQRHGLDVVATLRSEGVTDPEVLLAGLLHDAGKGQTGLWPRVIYSLGQAFGSWVPRVAAALPGFSAALVLLRDHAETSAAMALAAGCSPRTADLIRHQDAPIDPDAGRLLQLADEAN